MTYVDVLTKMETEYDVPVRYFLNMGSTRLDMNALVGHNLGLTFKGYRCLNCGSAKKIFRQGYCYDCFYKQADVGDWVMRPELSTAHLGIEDRDLEYEKEVQLKPHIVYLALSSNAKVGVTRKTQVPTRWIDQGASAALEIVETPNRYLAGITEVALKKHVSDKTNWRRMLKNEIGDTDLFELREQLKAYIPEEARPYFLESNVHLTRIEYPVTSWPHKVVSLNLSKTPEFRGRLNGIKGQYLIFENNVVFNVRSNEGTVVALDTD
ncbi:MAG TPA: DUF2797 domain-containing protein [Caldithrix abyssi]|uniref:DUF2797 domain-containing protein n=1 Tax=Caldithrix abyssi TaxID=187145 RepID=A0A7V5VE25_CALAY|nr:DUF2797 domain-containing protein [Caldithrix abyssi]